MQGSFLHWGAAPVAPRFLGPCWREQTEVVRSWREQTEVVRSWRERTKVVRSWREQTEVLQMQISHSVGTYGRRIFD